MPKYSKVQSSYSKTGQLEFCTETSRTVKKEMHKIFTLWINRSAFLHENWNILLCTAASNMDIMCGYCCNNKGWLELKFQKQSLMGPLVKCDNLESYSLLVCFSLKLQGRNICSPNQLYRPSRSLCCVSRIPFAIMRQRVPTAQTGGLIITHS